MDLLESMPTDWAQALAPLWLKEERCGLGQRLTDDYEAKTIYPPFNQLFRAFYLTPLAEVKVVILGQDPYFHPGQGEGLAFSVASNVKIPVSLANIFSALQEDLGFKPPQQGSLTSWAKEGVLLLNTSLTVESIKTLNSRAKAKYTGRSHEQKAWGIFSDLVISVVNLVEKPVVFLLWGNEAQNKSVLINQNKHLVLQTVHPSGLSAWRGFKQCRHFSQTNDFLKAKGREPVNWQL